MAQGSGLEDERTQLMNLLPEWPALGQLVETVVACWPDHASYLRKSFAVRSRGMMATNNRAAGAVLALAGDRAAQIAEDYRWLCGRVQEEEIHFARTGRYRYSTFEETNAHVYSDDVYMARYMYGLLYAHLLWYMHASSLHFYCQRLEARLPPGGRVLEVGPGHGLMLYLALTEFGCREAHGWDLSEVSLEQTRAALTLLGHANEAHFAIQDMHKVEPSGEPFDLLILSHILEHLEDPVGALQRMRPVLGKTGLIFINVPLYAPWPDHVVLLKSPDEAVDILRRAGFHVVEMGAHTTQGMPLSRALKRQVAVTCSIIAAPD